MDVKKGKFNISLLNMQKVKRGFLKKELYSITPHITNWKLDRSVQVHGRLALENNSEFGEAVLGRCSISYNCTSAF